MSCVTLDRLPRDGTLDRRASMENLTDISKPNEQTDQ